MYFADDDGKEHDSLGKDRKLYSSSIDKDRYLALPSISRDSITDIEKSYQKIILLLPLSPPNCTSRNTGRGCAVLGTSQTKESFTPSPSEQWLLATLPAEMTAAATFVSTKS
eukprot:10254740-Ditylum_brightwellii.AAC.1